MAESFAHISEHRYLTGLSSGPAAVSKKSCDSRPGALEKKAIAAYLGTRPLTCMITGQRDREEPCELPTEQQRSKGRVGGNPAAGGGITSGLSQIVFVAHTVNAHNSAGLPPVSWQAWPAPTPAELGRLSVQPSLAGSLSSRWSRCPRSTSGS